MFHPTILLGSEVFLSWLTTYNTMKPGWYNLLYIALNPQRPQSFFVQVTVEPAAACWSGSLAYNGLESLGKSIWPTLADLFQGLVLGADKAQHNYLDCSQSRRHHETIIVRMGLKYITPTIQDGSATIWHSYHFVLWRTYKSHSVFSCQSLSSKSPERLSAGTMMTAPMRRVET